MIDVIRKYLRSKKEIMAYHRCYDNMEQLGIAVFSMCSGNNDERCKKCQYYTEVKDNESND